MRYLSPLSIIVAMQFGINAEAQNNPVNILQKSLDNISSLKSVSYKINAVQKNPFSTGDTLFTKESTILTFNDKGLTKAMNKETNINNGQTKIRDIFLHDTLYSINLNDSIYSIERSPKTIYNALNAFVGIVNAAINKYPSKIVRHKDTTLDNIICYNLFVRVYDSIENNNHNYTYQYLLIDKKTLLPVYTKEIGAGTAEKEGYTLGRVGFYNVLHFSDFRLDEKIDNTIFYFNKWGFGLPNDKMLADGTVAPELKVKDLANHDVASANFKNKVLLIEFGATECGANPLANPMLNRLNKKYDKGKFSIASIYSDETTQQVHKYIESNKLAFPVYIGSKKLRRDFKTMGTPGFYLIDKEGRIILSSNGYSDELENELTEKIDKL